MRILIILVALLAASPAAAQNPRSNAPYDGELLRLAEVLGALHFLRRLCDPDEGPVWRDAMGSLLAAEKPSPDRATRLTARFNRGFGAFSRAYVKCTPAAVRAGELYQAEGVRLSSQITSRYAR